MKAILYIEIVGYDKPLEEADGSETYVELIKQFDITTNPAVGITLQFSPIPSHHPNAKSYQEVLRQASEIVSGRFNVTQVTYNVDDQEFTLSTDYGYYDYRTLNELNSIVDQLVLGYEFSRSDNSDV